jgi:predicted ferric reductase
MLMAATYLHIRSNKLWEPPAVYLLAAVCLQILNGILRFGNVLFSTFKYKKPPSRASVRKITFKRESGEDIQVADAVHVHVRLARPWQHRPGQYAYLCIPSISFGQSHPFYVSWWYRDGDNDYVVFIIQRRKGFTNKLLSYANNDLNLGFEMRALVEGPYGKELNLKSYGTVLLFATDIGIAGQLPYVAQLLESYRKCEAKTRRISLFWELDSERKLSQSSCAQHFS